ncbi:MAG: hypothetical protein IJM58_02415, partial [Muribaculaceae bacterium]|nr:hypothetical protein [Muribaculaceae bacterium]
MAISAYAAVMHNDNYVKSNLEDANQIKSFQKTMNSWMWYKNYLITTVYGVSDTAVTHSVYNDCLITPADLANNDNDKIPVNAKILGFQLDGYFNSSLSDVLKIYCWMKHTDQTAIENTGVNDGWKHNGYLDKLTDDWQYCNEQTFHLPQNATEQNPKPLYDVTFDNGKVFLYQGKNILMTIRNRALPNKLVDIHYLCAPAQTEIATFFRSGNYGYGGPATTGSSSEIDNMVMAESYQLPAFRWKYYTNDIFVTVNLLDPAGNAIAQDDITAEQPDGRPLLSIYDMTAQKQVAISGATPNAEGFVPVTPGQRIEVLNVDYTHQYRVTVKSATCGQDEVVASFGAISDDIDLTFTMQQEQTDPDPVRGDLNGDGKVDIADVNISINTMLGKEPSTELSDLNGDGRTDIADVN